MATNAPPDPDADKLATSCFDFLLIELVPLSYRMVQDLHAREHEAFLSQNPHLRATSSLQANDTTTGEQAAAAAGAGENAGEDKRASFSSSVGMRGGRRRRSVMEHHGGLGGGGDGKRGSQGLKSEDGATAGGATVATTGLGLGLGISSENGTMMTGDGIMAGTGAGVAGAFSSSQQQHEDEEMREAVFWRLDALGYRVGQGLVERFSASSPRPSQPLDMIKFICKDLWTLVFRKQIDNLKTNHRGTFVLTDARFQALARMSVDRARGSKGLEEALTKAQAFLWFPCGIIRGALSGFGLNVTVQAETTDLKGAVFQIRTVGSKP